MRLEIRSVSPANRLDLARIDARRSGRDLTALEECDTTAMRSQVERGGRSNDSAADHRDFGVRSSHAAHYMMWPNGHRTRLVMESRGGLGTVSASKTAVVTGTSTGIGYATSLHLARHGYRVFAGMRNLDRADALRTASAAEGVPVEVIALDVASGDSVDAAFRRVTAEGSIDVLVNNAGISGASPLELTPDAEHHAMFETNYFGAIRCIQAVLPAMRERGRGAIVNVTSVAGIVAIPNQ